MTVEADLLMLGEFGEDAASSGSTLVSTSPLPEASPLSQESLGDSASSCIEVVASSP